MVVAVAGTGLGYQWSKDDVAIAGAVGPTLTLAQASAATMGFYSVTVTNSAGTVAFSFATVTINTGGASRLINVATRGYVSAGSALTPGFVLQGTGTKPLVIRAIGPTLSAFGLGGALADPMLEVIPLGSSTAIATNDNWGGSTTLSTAFSNVGAFPLDQPASKDASVVGSFSSAGATGYSARITSAAIGGAGLALAEVYDDGPLNAPVRLVNVSTIGFVGIGEQALIPGFVIGGNAPKQVLIRAVGPGLQPFGVPDLLANPQLSVAPLGKNFSIATNDNWGGTAELQAAFNQASAFALPPGSADAAVLLRLPPGGYSVVVSGVGNTTGTALVEVYDLDPCFFRCASLSDGRWNAKGPLIPKNAGLWPALPDHERDLRSRPVHAFNQDALDIGRLGRAGAPDHVAITAEPRDRFGNIRGDGRPLHDGDMHPRGERGEPPHRRGVVQDDRA